jgi:hypothetical protein
MLVVEAKQGDLQRGFNQLAVELIALDRWMEEEPEPTTLWGAVSVGDVWRFGFLERKERRLAQRSRRRRPVTPRVFRSRHDQGR